MISKVNSTPGRTRTCGPQIRNLLLYPAELRALNRFIVTTYGERFHCLKNVHLPYTFQNSRGGDLQHVWDVNLIGRPRPTHTLGRVNIAASCRGGLVAHQFL